MRDLKTKTTILVSVNRAGTASGNGNSFIAVLSAKGRRLAFASDASDLVANDTNGATDIFVRDLKTGTATLASVNDAGTASGNNFSLLPALSANGRRVAFASDASDLAANDTNGTTDLFVHDLKTKTTTLVSVNSAGTASGNSASGFTDPPALSANGRFVAFVSAASDLAANDTNRVGDLFVRDLKTGTTTLVSVNRAGTASGNGFSFLSPALSANGRRVAFASDASDLVANGTNGVGDLFARPIP